MSTVHGLDPAMVRLNVQSFASHLSSLVDDGHRAHTQVQELQSYVSRLTLQQGLLRNERDEAKTETAQCKETIRALSNRVKEFLSDNNQLTDDCNRAIKTVQQGEGKQKILEEKVLHLERQIANTEAELKVTKAKCSGLDLDNMRLREINKKAALSLEDAKKEHAKVSGEKTQQQLAYENGVTKLKAKDGELTKLKIENAQLQTKNNTLSYDIECTKKQCAGAKVDKEKTASLETAKVAELSRMIKAQKQMSEEQSRSYLRLSDENQKQAKENVALQKNVAELTDHNKALSQELKKLKGELEEMKENIKAMDSMVEESTQYIEQMEQKYGPL